MMMQNVSLEYMQRPSRGIYRCYVPRQYNLEISHVSECAAELSVETVQTPFIMSVTTSLPNCHIKQEPINASIL